VWDEMVMRINRIVGLPQLYLKEVLVSRSTEPGAMMDNFVVTCMLAPRGIDFDRVIWG